MKFKETKIIFDLKTWARGTYYSHADKSGWPAGWLILFISIRIKVSLVLLNFFYCSMLICNYLLVFEFDFFFSSNFNVECDDKSIAYLVETHIAHTK